MKLISLSLALLLGTAAAGPLHHKHPRQLSSSKKVCNGTGRPPRGTAPVTLPLGTATGGGPGAAEATLPAGGFGSPANGTELSPVGTSQPPLGTGVPPLGTGIPSGVPVNGTGLAANGTRSACPPRPTNGTAPAATAEGGLVESTIYETKTYTITSCAPEVTNCPAGNTSLVVSTVPVSTTLVPVSAAATGSGLPPAGNPAGATSLSPDGGAPAGSGVPAVTGGASLVESIIFETKTYTITSCAPEVTDCPARNGSVVVSTIPLSTTLVPASVAATGSNSPAGTTSLSPEDAASSASGVPAGSGAAGTGAPLVTGEAGGLVESTVFETKTFTITSCAPEVTDCPARNGSVVVSTIPVSTTLVPASAAASGSGPAAVAESTALSAGAQPPFPGTGIPGTGAVGTGAVGTGAVGTGAVVTPTPLASLPPIVRNVTSTVYNTSTIASTSNGKVVYITSVIPAYTTICPVTATPVLTDSVSTSLSTGLVTTSSGGSIITITSVVPVPHTIYQTVYITATGAPPVPASVIGTEIGVQTPSPSATTDLSPTGLVPSGSAPSGVFPSGAAPSGVFPSAAAPSGVFPSGVAPSGVAPSGFVPTGGLPAGVITKNITSTVYSTATISTVSAGSTILVTSVIPVYTTVCPVTATPVVSNVVETSLSTGLVTKSSAGQVITVTSVVPVPKTIYQTVYITADGAPPIPATELAATPVTAAEVTSLSTQLVQTVSQGSTYEITQVITVIATPTGNAGIPGGNGGAPTGNAAVPSGNGNAGVPSGNGNAGAPPAGATDLSPTGASSAPAAATSNVGGGNGGSGGYGTGSNGDNGAGNEGGAATALDATVSVPPVGATITSDTPVWITSVVYSTNLITVTACAETVTNCPAKSDQRTSVITSVVEAYTTICPVTLTAGATVPTGIASAPVTELAAGGIGGGPTTLVTTVTVASQTVVPAIPTASPTSAPPAAPSTSSPNWWAEFRKWLAAIMEWLKNQGQETDGQSASNTSIPSVPFNGTGGFNTTSPFNVTGPANSTGSIVPPGGLNGTGLLNFTRLA